ncbi:cGMP-dependent protein kinase, isozyme 1 [Patella vulgata]|uniref:cGMP-dependent protein kinase, isozyme 1 n=1 Tax=Patella vulgata TaxID=6465 RepID=UPI00217F550B|nr:cGMP-dependent protein kinase, isozyme 1 [Patella vulgata]
MPPPVSKSTTTSGATGKVSTTGSSSSKSTSVAKTGAKASTLTPKVKMGNGASATQVVVDGETYDLGKLKLVIPEMKTELKDKDNKIRKLEIESRDKTKQINEHSKEITRLKEEVHKLKSVLQLKVHKDGKPDILATIQESETPLVIQEVRSKKQGVSGESSSNSQSNVELKHHDKDFRSKQLIKDAILDNDFLKNLDSTQVREIVDCMYDKKIQEGHFIIKEGESGNHLYVSADGEVEVQKDGQILGRMASGRAFGELAILYNCTRTASVKALTEVKVWVLDRGMFQAIMMKTGIQRRDENIKYLRSVPLLRDLPADKLSKLADVLEIDFYHEGEYIIREGATGDSFFILNKGEVKVTQRIQGHNNPQEIRKLKRGDYFGEKALLSEDRRTANVIALPPGVECLTVDRDSFNQLIGDLNELRNKDYGDAARGASRCSMVSSPRDLVPKTKKKIGITERK